MIADGEAVVLDSGTTCLEVARLLRNRRVTVMPLSLQAANALADAPATNLLLAGGRPRPGEGALTGPLTRASLQAVRFDTAVIGCCGLTAEHGLTAYDLDDADIKRAAICSSRRVIAVTEAAKLSRTALAFVSPVAALHALVTDASAQDDEVQAISAAGVSVLTV
jgi:DeoR/GlpR family transcriptional regulator of sugar metabolism